MTESELELLTLAAKAADLEVFRGPLGSQYDYWSMYLKNPKGDFYNGIKWNPLSDDGDALRLLVRLRLTVNLTECRCCAGVYACQLDGDGDYPDVSVRHSPDFDDAETTDPYAATRLAIVRAAAEIGKSMEAKP